MFRKCEHTEILSDFSGKSIGVKSLTLTGVTQINGISLGSLRKYKTLFRAQVLTALTVPVNLFCFFNI